MGLSTYVFTVIADKAKEIVAIGKQVIPPIVEYILTFRAENGCTISPIGEQSIQEGTVVTVTVGTLEGYEIDKILVDGVDILNPPA